MGIPFVACPVFLHGMLSFLGVITPFSGACSEARASGTVARLALNTPNSHYNPPLLAGGKCYGAHFAVAMLPYLVFTT
jgi:hypothetical protein